MYWEQQNLEMEMTNLKRKPRKLITKIAPETRVKKKKIEVFPARLELATFRVLLGEPAYVLTTILRKQLTRIGKPKQKVYSGEKESSLLDFNPLFSEGG